MGLGLLQPIKLITALALSNLNILEQRRALRKQPSVFTVILFKRIVGTLLNIKEFVFVETNIPLLDLLVPDPEMNEVVLSELVPLQNWSLIQVLQITQQSRGISNRWSEVKT